MDKSLCVAIQGIRGSYHHVAVEKFFGRETDSRTYRKLSKTEKPTTESWP